MLTFVCDCFVQGLYFVPQVSLISCSNLIIIALSLLTFAYDIVLFRGYIEAIREIEQQLQIGTSQIKFDDIVVACGRFHSIPSVFNSLNMFCCHIMSLEFYKVMLH